MKNKIIEISHIEAIQAYSMQDFKQEENLTKYHEFNNSADQRKYFIDLDMEKIIVRYYKNGEYVDSLLLNSTKTKYKKISKYFNERLYEREFYNYEK